MAKRRKKADETVLFGRDKRDNGEECTVTLANGKQLCCPLYPTDCDYIRILDEDGEELGYWHYTEFTEDAKDVMGAMMGLLNREED
jgi:hypothetical protein